MADELKAAKKLYRAARLLLEAGAPGPEHKRLQRALEEWADRHQYDASVTAKSGARPDVLRRRGERFVLVGDAKDAEHENAYNTDTLKRICRYLEDFGAALLSGQIDGGIIAVATNNAAAAEDWRLALDVLAREEGLASDAGPPRFQVEKLEKEDTWIIWW
jgi:hypothetical protein